MPKIDYNSVDFKSNFRYDESSPTCLVWNKNVYCCKPQRLLKPLGSVAGGVDKRDGYCRTYLDGKSYLAHRIIWVLFNGKISDGCEIDHMDGNRSNNNIDNLREVPRVINSRNHKMKRNNTTGVNGVSLKHNGCGQYYYVARWRDSSLQKELTKHFSIDIFGSEVAFKLACDYREEMIRLQNTNGAGYSNRHGT